MFTWDCSKLSEMTLVGFQSHLWLLGIIFTFSSHTLYFNQYFSIVYYFSNFFLQCALSDEDVPFLSRRMSRFVAWHGSVSDSLLIAVIIVSLSSLLNKLHGAESFFRSPKVAQPIKFLKFYGIRKFFTHLQKSPSLVSIVS
jgi:hypothetical protein